MLCLPMRASRTIISPHAVVCVRLASWSANAMVKKSKDSSLIIPELPGFEGLMKVDLFSDKGDALDETGLQPLPDALPITVKRLHTSNDLEAVLSDILSANIIGLDLETTGLDPKVHKMRLIQIAVGQTVYVIDCWEMDPHCIQIIL